MYLVVLWESTDERIVRSFNVLVRCDTQEGGLTLKICCRLFQDLSCHLDTRYSKSALTQSLHPQNVYIVCFKLNIQVYNEYSHPAPY